MEIKSGLRPILYDKNDYSFHPSFGTVAPVVYPDNYDVDLHLWTPDQNNVNVTPIFTVQPQPTGCTNFTTSDCSADESGFLRNPTDVENVTHANANGGADVRVSLKAAITPLKWATAYFNIQPTGGLDFFDSIRLAMLYTREEKRAVSAGTPWFPEFMSPYNGIMPMPTDFNTQRASWHNWAITGWKTINGTVYLTCKPWIGANYGDKGFGYMSRELCNKLFAIMYTGAYTLSKRPANANIPISFNLVAWLLTMWKKLVPNG